MLRQFLVFMTLLAATNLSHAETSPETILKATDSTMTELSKLKMDLITARGLMVGKITNILRACANSNCTESDSEIIDNLQANITASERLSNDIKLLEKDLEAFRRGLIYIKLSKDDGKQFAIENIYLDKHRIESMISNLKEDTDSKDLTYKLLYEKYFIALKRLQPLLIEYKIPETSRKKSN